MEEKIRPLGPEAAAKKFGWPRTRPNICEMTINFECNSRCVFCYNPNFQPEWHEGELSLKEIAVALKTTRMRKGAWFADILGGEVTLRKDLPDIARIARKIGYTAVQITTNGLLLSDYDYAKRLFDAGINVFRISLHGATEKEHDRLVGVPGGFKKTVQAIRNVTKIGARAGINHIILPDNYKSFPEFAKLICDDLMLDAYLFISPHYLGAMKTNSMEYKIRYSDYMPYLRKALEYFEKKNLLLESPCLSNFVPCVLPEYVNLMAEWKYQKNDDSLFVPNQEPVDIYKMKERQRMKISRCKECAYYNECMGFEREYFNYFGGDEFVPLKEKMKKERLHTYFEG